MRSKSVTELHQAFLTRGGYRNSTVWSLTNFVELLNTSVAEVWRLLADTWEDYFLKEITGSVSTEAGTDVYELPDDFWRLVLVELADGSGKYYPLHRVGLLTLNRARAESGDPVYYHLRGTPFGDDDIMTPVIVVGPVPTAVRGFRFTYVPAPPLYVLDDEETGEVTFDGIAGYEKLVLELCLYDAYKRAKMPVVECQQEIARLTQDLRNSAPNRDAYQPRTIAQYVRESSRSGNPEDLL